MDEKRRNVMDEKRLFYGKKKYLAICICVCVCVFLCLCFDDGGMRER
jgi:hypothetical protein